MSPGPGGVSREQYELLLRAAQRNRAQVKVLLGVVEEQERKLCDLGAERDAQEVWLRAAMDVAGERSERRWRGRP